MTTLETPHITGKAAGVPFVAIGPPRRRADAPVVFAWHLMDPPRTERALAAALPLQGLDAWRIYFGLPLHGDRAPAGGVEELMRLGYEDAVGNLYGPISAAAAAEFPAAYEELRAQFGFGEGPIGLVGGSLGAAVAQLVLAESELRVTAAVLASPVVQLKAVVDSFGPRFGIVYPWSDPSLAIARRLDFVARAAELARTEPAVLLVVGEEDDSGGFLEPAAGLRLALAGSYRDPGRVDLVVVPGMAHALAPEPGDAPAPQTEHAAVVDRHAVAWLQRHLIG